MAKKEMTENDIEEKIKDLKMNLLKQPTKRKDIKKEIARLLTLKKSNKSKEGNKGKE